MYTDNHKQTTKQTQANTNNTSQPASKRVETFKNATTHFTQQHQNTWNNLPERITSITSLNIFKKALNTYLLEAQSTQLKLKLSYGHHFT
jgi:hypothetical protein